MVCSTLLSVRCEIVWDLAATPDLVYNMLMTTCG